MNLSNFGNLEVSIKSTLDKLSQMDYLINQVLENTDPDKIRFSALTELMSVKLQYLNFLSDLQEKQKAKESPNEVLDILKKAPEELRNEFLVVWEKIVKYVEEQELQDEI